MRLKCFCCLLLLSGCMLQPTNFDTPTLSPPIFPTAVPAWTDASEMISGICFESALDAAGQVFIMRDEAALKAFYDAADNSQLCRHPVKRVPFDFSAGRVLAGLWSRGQGCVAYHEVLGVQRDDTARTLVIGLRFIPEGDCNYELVRGFWVALDGAADYQITILIE